MSMSYGAQDSQAAEPAWRKASLCFSGECVEVSAQDGMVLMRDSKNPRGDVLHYSVDDWRSFVWAVQSGQFDDLCRP
jgi:Domain of unknown function (DUF397)